MIKEFKKVMEFTRQPFVYVTTTTTVQSQPVLDAQDTLRTQGVFYKNETDLYYSTGQEEMYLQDSLLVQVNHDRKTIWISRVDKGSKEKLGEMPTGNRQLQEMMRKNYSMKRTETDHHLAKLSFETKEVTGRSAVISTRGDLLFTEKDHLPRQMDIEMRMQQPASAEMIEQIKSQGVDERKLVQLVNGQQCLVRMQRMTVLYNSIDNTKQKAMQMPLWQTILDFDAVSQNYSGKGVYAEYAITKTY